jgi:hypothetical protein
MKKFVHAAVMAAGFAVASATALTLCATMASAADLPLSLQSFGASKAKSSYELSAVGVAGFALQPQVAAALGSRMGLATAAYGAPLSLYSNAFASSAPLSPTLALDTAKGMDVGSRFSSYDSQPSPFLSAVNAPFLDLANGGRYTGVTFVPAGNLRLRTGMSLSSERLDRFAFEPVLTSGNLALSYDPSQTQSLLAGVSWDISSAIGLDLTGISSERKGLPLGFASSASVAPRASTNALSVASRLGLGDGWVTTASFSEGMTQLDQRINLGGQQRDQVYTIAIAKHGLFGEDALGLSVSRPTPGLSNSFSSLIGSGDLPPLIVGNGQALAGRRAPETDFQLGYVTNFLDGAVALQTNAAYQMNYQGQQGANSLSLLSRAKIKF